MEQKKIRRKYLLFLNLFFICGLLLASILLHNSIIIGHEINRANEPVKFEYGYTPLSPILSKIEHRIFSTQVSLKIGYALFRTEQRKYKQVVLNHAIVNYIRPLILLSLTFMIDSNLWRRRINIIRRSRRSFSVLSLLFDLSKWKGNT